MSAYVLSNLINDLGKSDKMRVGACCRFFPYKFNKFNNTGV